jgi:hypothetical protein
MSSVAACCGLHHLVSACCCLLLLLLLDAAPAAPACLTPLPRSPPQLPSISRCIISAPFPRSATSPRISPPVPVYLLLCPTDVHPFPISRTIYDHDPLSPPAHADAPRSGLTVKFAFNCILIDKDGIHNIDLSLPDPIGAMEAAASASGTTTEAAEGSGTGTVSAAPVSAA